jgi:hypothetical protein
VTLKDMMLARHEELRGEIDKLHAELEPLETEFRELDAALAAMGAVAPSAPSEGVVVLAERLRPSEPRVRPDEVQQAINTQTSSIGVPDGMALFCGCGYESRHPSTGFTDQMALRTHTTRNHDREPTEAEKTPRRWP